MQAQSGTGNAAVLRADVNKHDIRAHPFDAVPGDHIVIPATQKPKKTASAGNNNG